MRRSAAAVSAIAAAAALAACGGSSGAGNSSGKVNANGCTTPPALTKSIQHYAAEPPLTIARTTYTARIVTNCGTIVVALDGAKAPHTVNSFAFLAGHHYFDDTPCPRVVTQGIFVLQCGDPTGTGAGGPGYTLPDENLTGATYPAGTLAMANTGQPHTGGSQFFFVYADSTAALQPLYTPFGHVVSGLDVLTRIAKAGDDGSNQAGGGHPNQPVVIESFTVTQGS